MNNSNDRQTTAECPHVLRIGRGDGASEWFCITPVEAHARPWLHRSVNGITWSQTPGVPCPWAYVEFQHCVTAPAPRSSSACVNSCTAVHRGYPYDNLPHIIGIGAVAEVFEVWKRRSDLLQAVPVDSRDKADARTLRDAADNEQLRKDLFSANSALQDLGQFLMKEHRMLVGEGVVLGVPRVIKLVKDLRAECSGTASDLIAERRDNYGLRKQLHEESIKRIAAQKPPPPFVDSAARTSILNLANAVELLLDGMSPYNRERYDRVKQLIVSAREGV